MSGPLITAWRRFEQSSDAYLAVTAMLILLIIAPIAVSGFPEIERPLTAVLAGLTVGQLPTREGGSSTWHCW